MSRLRRVLHGWVAMAVVLTVPSQASTGINGKFPGIGRTATPAEVAAWDIDVRPDFKGLPKGSGSVALGQKVWDEKCATCHGTFGESNEVFPPIVGNTTAEDIRVGRVKALTEPVGRTTLMKLSNLSAIWDYINRAMPWDRPKSLTADEVYASVAYILHLGDVVPADFVLSDRNIVATQGRLPNRNGNIRYEPLWNVRGKGDVANTACANDCQKTVEVTSYLPDYARNAHGNLAQQHRLTGPVRGVDTTQTGGRNAAPQVVENPALALATKYNCMACHRIEGRQIGPSFRDVAARYQDKAEAATYLAKRVSEGGGGVWGAIPMPANSGIPTADLKGLIEWVLNGAK